MASEDRSLALMFRLQTALKQVDRLKGAQDTVRSRIALVRKVTPSSAAPRERVASKPAPLFTSARAAAAALATDENIVAGAKQAKRKPKTPVKRPLGDVQLNTSLEKPIRVATIDPAAASGYESRRYAPAGAGDGPVAEEAGRDDYETHLELYAKQWKDSKRWESDRTVKTASEIAAATRPAKESSRSPKATERGSNPPRIEIIQAHGIPELAVQDAGRTMRGGREVSTGRKRVSIDGEDMVSLAQLSAAGRGARAGTKPGSKSVDTAARGAVASATESAVEQIRFLTETLKGSVMDRNQAVALAREIREKMVEMHKRVQTASQLKRTAEAKLRSRDVEVERMRFEMDEQLVRQEEAIESMAAELREVTDWYAGKLRVAEERARCKEQEISDLESLLHVSEQQTNRLQAKIELLRQQIDLRCYTEVFKLETKRTIAEALPAPAPLPVVHSPSLLEVINLEIC